MSDDQALVQLHFAERSVREGVHGRLLAGMRATMQRQCSNAVMACLIATDCEDPPMLGLQPPEDPHPCGASKIASNRRRQNTFFAPRTPSKPPETA